MAADDFGVSGLVVTALQVTSRLLQAPGTPGAQQWPQGAVAAVGLAFWVLGGAHRGFPSGQCPGGVSGAPPLCSTLAWFVSTTDIALLFPRPQMISSRAEAALWAVPGI